jgi:hypothetical protein
MDDYPYTTLGADGWFRCDGLHHPSFPTLLWDVLHCFGYMGIPMYRGRPHRQFGLGRYTVHMDIPAHPTNPTMTVWFTTARGDDLDDTLEMAVHQASRSSVSTTCRSSVTSSSPCSLFGTRATRYGVSF